MIVDFHGCLPTSMMISLIRRFLALFSSIRRASILMAWSTALSNSLKIFRCAHRLDQESKSTTSRDTATATSRRVEVTQRDFTHHLPFRRALPLVAMRAL